MGRWLSAYRNQLTGYSETATNKTDRRDFWRFWQYGSPEQLTFGFCRLVRAFGTAHGELIEDETILVELNDRDIEYLRTIDTNEKQVWAELLAYRLAKN